MAIRRIERGQMRYQHMSPLLLSCSLKQPSCPLTQHFVRSKFSSRQNSPESKPLELLPHAFSLVGRLPVLALMVLGSRVRTKPPWRCIRLLADFVSNEKTRISAIARPLHHCNQLQNGLHRITLLRGCRVLSCTHRHSPHWLEACTADWLITSFDLSID